MSKAPILGLATVMLGAVFYANANRGLVINGAAAWMVMFLVMMPVDGVLIKHTINTSGLSPWGLVLYQNIIAGTIGVLCVAVLELGSLSAAAEAAQRLLTIEAFIPVMLASVLGVSLSYFQMNVRRVVSSTTFMVLGVSNKFLALLLSQLFLSNSNGSFVSIGGVLLSMAGAVGFQQTVKGKGMSQAPQQQQHSSEGASLKAFFAMLAGFIWAVYLFQA